MSPEQRRDMIVAAAVPLLLEHGAAVSTLQIARAAGIGEATVFRAFTDKDELLAACVAAVLRNDQVLTELDEIPLDQPLAARLTEAAATLRAYLDRMGAVLGAVHAAGGRRLERRPPSPSEEAEPAHGGAATPTGPARPVGGRAEALDRTRQAVIRLLEPGRAHLRLPVEEVATLFLSMLFPQRGPVAPDAPIELLVDVFLHGAATEQPLA